MKELTEEHKDKVIEIKEERQEIKQPTIVRRRRKIPGHIHWEINLTTKEIKRAQTQESRVVVNNLNKGEKKGTYIQHKVIFKEGHEYVQALNYKNAVKHFKKGGYL